MVTALPKFLAELRRDSYLGTTNVVRIAFASVFAGILLAFVLILLAEAVGLVLFAIFPHNPTLGRWIVGVAVAAWLVAMYWLVVHLGAEAGVSGYKLETMDMSHIYGVKDNDESDEKAEEE
jgi:uncharacterized membrane protein